MRILYIPFTFEDVVFDLQRKAAKWKENYQIKGKEILIIYHDSDESLKARVKRTLELGNCHIYILGHGLNTAELAIANQAKENEFFVQMTIEDVADHFKEDLVSAKISADTVIKLYFCDEYQNRKPRLMAEKFRECLGESLGHIEIQYYSEVSVSAPGRINSLDTKKASRTLWMGNEDCYIKLSCIVGKSSSFRQGLNEAQTARFFCIQQSSSAKNIKYPAFSHAFLLQLSQVLVYGIQHDKVLSKNQDRIIASLFDLLPIEITPYKNKTLFLSGYNLFLEMKINLALLLKHLNPRSEEAYSNNMVHTMRRAILSKTVYLIGFNRLLLLTYNNSTEEPDIPNNLRLKV